MKDASQWVAQGMVLSNLDIPMPAGRTNLRNFIKCTISAGGGNRRFFYNTTTNIVDTAGVYTMSAMVFVPYAGNYNLTVGASLNALSEVHHNGRWQYVRVRCYFNVGDYLIPTFQMLGDGGEVFYVGEISVSKGENSVYSSSEIVVSNPASGIKTNANVFTSRSGGGIAANTKGKVFSILIQDQNNDNFFYGVGSWQSGAPVITQQAALNIGTGATNSAGTITVTGSTDYIITLTIL